MSSLLKLLKRLLPLTLVVGFLGTACVRLNEPSTYRCDSDSDCDGDEKCAYKECKPSSWCDSDSLCRNEQICMSGQCVPPLCTPGSLNCGNLACLNGRCASYCSGDRECRVGFACQGGGSCVQRGQIANGGTCQVAADCTSKVCCGSFCAVSCPKRLGDSCVSSNDCASGYCCPLTAGSASVCSGIACAPPPECTSDAECGVGKHCQAQKCVNDPPAIPAANGTACAKPEGCQSGVCQGGICRGLAGSECNADTQCESAHVCCTLGPNASGRVCGGPNGGCPGTIGASCKTSSDCFEGNCNGSWCYRSCSVNGDCGVSPWGVANACETNGQGNPICFPGCTTTSECQTNLTRDLTCFVGPESGAMLCAVQ